MTLLLCGGMASAQAQQYDPSQIVYFGDSFLDIGNVSEPINTAAQSGLGIGGNFAQQLSGKFNETITASSFGGTDYAQSGAYTSGGTYNSSSQVSSYLTNVGSHASTTALFVFAAGTNDVVHNATASNYASVGATAADNVAAQIQTLANAGAQTFLWFNLYNTSVTPEFTGNSVDAEAVTAYNNEWSVDIANLRANDPTLHFVPFDSYTFGTSLINNGVAHGFTDTTDAWTTAPASVPYSEASSDPNADKFFFYDAEHPTTYADAIIASKAYTELETPEPSTLLLLTSGLLLLFVFRQPNRHRA